MDRRYNGLTLAWQQAATDPLRFDGALAAHWIRHRVHGQNAAALVNLEFLNRTVADRDESVARAESLGATVLRSDDTDWTRQATLRDPQGAVFTASQYAPPE